VREIMQLSNAPLGSITNHFQSKESSALAVLNRYFDRLSVNAAYEI